MKKTADKRFVRTFGVLIAVCFFSLTAGAQIVDTYRFHNSDDRARATELAKSLRCPQCQNQNLLESNSPIAYDLRLEVYKMVDEGKSDQQIIERMTARFGDFVRYNPPFKRTTALLWLGPSILFLAAGGLTLRYLRRRNKAANAAAGLNPAQRAVLNKLLNSQDNE